MELEKVIKKNFIYRSDIKRLVSKSINASDYELKNETSVFIIEKIFKGNHIKEIIREMADCFSVDEKTIKEDVYCFLNEIQKNSTQHQTITKREGIPVNANMEALMYPLFIEIELTQRCQWKCKFCYNIWKHCKIEENNIDLDFSVFKNIVDESISNGCNIIRLSGGEPTLHPEFKRIVKYASDKGCKIVLFTNGQNIDDNFIKFAKKYRIMKILLSLHGMKKTHDNFTGVQGGFEHTIKVIKKLSNEGINVGVETILTKKTDEENMEKMAKLIKSLGVKDWNLMPYVKTNSDILNRKYELNIEYADKIIKKIIKEYKINIRLVCSQKLCLGMYNLDTKKNIEERYYIDGNCGSGIYWVSISFDGKIRNCPHSMQYAGTADEGIKNIYLNRLKPEIMRIYNLKDERCVNCEVYNSCKGGCHLKKVGNYR